MKRVHSQATAYMQWFVEFVEKDLPHLRAGDWLNLREDVWRVLRGLPLTKTSESAPLFLPEDDQRLLTPEQLIETQLFVKEWLESVARANADRKEWGLKGPPEYRIRSNIPLRGRIHSVTFAADQSGTPWIIVEADDLRDVFLFTLGALWGRMDALRHCPTTDCKRLFLPTHGKQKFCSDQCQNRTKQRRHREKHPDRISDRAHRYYRQKTEARTPTKNIQRRQRTKPKKKRRLST